jgi:hypothetical protein
MATTTTACSPRRRESLILARDAGNGLLTGTEVGDVTS